MHQKTKMQQLGLEAYHQLCFDEDGPYLVRHCAAWKGPDDLEVYDVDFRSKAVLEEQWRKMFGGGPDTWEDKYSKLSYFKRRNWQKLKREVDMWRGLG